MAPRTDDASPHYVYRAYDKNGRCLYIGCTKDAEARLNHHRRYGSPWIFEAEKFRMTVHPGFKAGREAEAKAIAEEQPVWNVQGRFKMHDTWTREEWHEYVRNRVAIAQPFTRAVATHLINAENLYRLKFGEFYPTELHQAVANHIAEFRSPVTVPTRYADLIPSDSKASA